MSFRRTDPRLAVALALAVQLFASEGAAQSLFSDARGARVAQVPVGQGAQVPGAPGAVVRMRSASIDMSLLASAGIEALTSAPDSSLVLNLFDDVVLVAAGERVETDRWGHRSWVGRVEGVPNSTVTFTWLAGTVVGTVHAGPAVYRIEATGGLARISEVDLALSGIESEPLEPPSAEMAGRGASKEAPYAAQEGPQAGSLEARSAHETEVVDIFVYYTPAAESRQGGHTQIEALVAKGIADTNTAFLRSQVAKSVRLVGTRKATGYVEDPFSLETDLRSVTFSPEAAVARDASGADIVALLVAGPAGGACGIAWLGPSPQFSFSVSAAECLADGQWTFTHEIAHNFGSHHNIENAPGSAFRPYSYGYYDVAAGFRTVMSYPGSCGGCPRILNYSNPVTTFLGRPAGAALANNARSLVEAFPLVAAFRDGPLAVPGPPQNVHATVSGLTSEIAWAPPVSGGAPTTYIGQAGSAPGASDIFNGPVGLSNSVSVTTKPGVYYARIFAQNEVGTSATSNEVAVTVGVSCDTPPAPAIAVTATGPVVRASWTPGPGANISGYTVLVGSSPGASDVYQIPVGLSTEIAGTLQPGTYHIRIATHAPCGAATTSSEAVVRIF